MKYKNLIFAHPVTHYCRRIDNRTDGFVFLGEDCKNTDGKSRDHHVRLVVAERNQHGESHDIVNRH